MAKRVKTRVIPGRSGSRRRWRTKPVTISLLVGMNIAGKTKPDQKVASLRVEEEGSKIVGEIEFTMEEFGTLIAGRRVDGEWKYFG